MTVQPGANLYTQGFGSRPEGVEIPHFDVRAPTIYDVNYPVGKRWIYSTTNTEYSLTSLTSSNGVVSATWTLLGAGSGDLNTLTTQDSTIVTPTSGNINLSGSGSTTTVGSGSTATVELTGLTNHAVLVGAGSTTITKLTVGTNGQVLIGSTGADPAFGTLSSTTGLTFTGGAGTLAVNIAQGGFKANSVATASATGASQNSYICSDSAQTTISLPSTAAVGDMIIAVGTNANIGGLVFSCGGGQTVYNLASSSTTSVATGAKNTVIALMCTTANTAFTVMYSEGTLTFA